MRIETTEERQELAVPGEARVGARAPDGANRRPERHDTIVIGGGQAGLAAGYYLKKRGIPFVILDASQRIGDAWRNRWDSLRLFTPAAYDGLPGMDYPAHPHYFPTKDEFADFLEEYAATFELPVRLNSRVDRLARNGDRFTLRWVTGGWRRGTWSSRWRAIRTRTCRISPTTSTRPFASCTRGSIGVPPSFGRGRSSS